MTSELRPEFDIAADISTACGAKHVTPRAISIIKADRQAVRAEQAAELAKWRDKYNEIGQLALEQVSDLGTKLGRAEVELDAAKADLQGANRELAKFKTLAETLAGELQQIEVDAMEYYNEWRETGCDQKDAIRFAFGLGEETRKALREYKEARDV